MPEDLSTVRDDFIAFLRARPGGANTAQTYAWGVGKLSKWLLAQLVNGGTRWDAMQPQDFASIINWMHAAGYAPRSVRLAGKAISAFYNWAVANGRCQPLDITALSIPPPPPLRARRTPDVTTLAYLDACKYLPDPIRCVCSLLPMTRLPTEALCSAPLSGLVQVTQDANDLVLHVKKHGAQLEDADLVERDLSSIQEELTSCPLIPSAVAELRDYSARWRGLEPERASSLWLFPRKDDSNLHLTADAVHDGTQRVKEALGARHLTPRKARRARE